MHLEIKHKRGVPILLPAVAYLESTKALVSGIPKEGIRHPVATYNVSVQGVISATKELLGDLEKGYPLVGNYGAERILAVETLRGSTKQLLLAMGEHVDACEKIIGCYLSGTDKQKLKKAKKELRDNLGWYERHVMAQANHIKHRHAQVRSITMHDPSLAVPGYYIETAIGEEAVGPDPTVHGKGNTAFSYARETRLAICGLFYISRSLEAVLRKYFGKSESAESKEPSGLMELIERVANFPTAMFPDEYQKKIPSIEITTYSVLISFGRVKPPRIPYGSIQFRTQTVADGVSRTYQIPYLNMNAKNS